MSALMRIVESDTPEREPRRRSWYSPKTAKIAGAIYGTRAKEEPTRAIDLEAGMIPLSDVPFIRWLQDDPPSYALVKKWTEGSAEHEGLTVRRVAGVWMTTEIWVYHFLMEMVRPGSRQSREDYAQGIDAMLLADGPF